MKRKNKKLPLRKRILVALGVVIGVLLILSAGLALYKSSTDTIRLNRIKQIYSNLHLGSEYQPTYSSIFGEKRPYEWDKSRSYSSEIDYVVGKNVDSAVADVRKAIESEGFSYFEEPYPGAAFVELHFKSARGEYIRLTVSSKLRDDAFKNAVLMKMDTSQATKVDPNAGPANVSIKVNLDDNNE